MTEEVVRRSEVDAGVWWARKLDRPQVPRALLAGRTLRTPRHFAAQVTTLESHGSHRPRKMVTAAAKWTAGAGVTEVSV